LGEVLCIEFLAQRLAALFSVQSLKKGIGLWWCLPLLVPSLWLWLNIPPLWRDSDGFNQVTAEIGGLTLLLWPPLYCLLARVPLALGAWWERVPFSFDRPTLTDSGVGLLLLAQHILLIAAFAWFIAVIARRPLTRVILSIALAGLASFFVFAQTVGTESLSNTMQFAVMAGAVVLLKDPKLRIWPWLGFSLLLALAIGSRHVNAVLAALLPTTLILRGLWEGLRARPGSRVGVMRSAAIRVGIAVLAGVFALVMVNLTVRSLCSITGTTYHSKFGFIFQWRTEFIETKTPKDQEQFFSALKRSMKDPLAIRATEAYASELRKGYRPGPEFLSTFVKQTLKEDKRFKRKDRLALAADTLNHIARTILTTAPPGYADAVLGDVSRNFAVSPDAITGGAASSTQFFVNTLTRPEFEQLRKLVTFRDGYYRKAITDFESHPYLTAGRGFSLIAATGIAIGLCFLSLAIPRLESWQRFYPPALLLVGWLLIFLNCCSTFFMPRFTLPLLGTTVAAAFIALAGMLDWLFVYGIVKRTGVPQRAFEA
jgi:hypothetical protein